MSNPIADTAEYFTEKDDQISHVKHLPKPELRIYPSQPHSSSYHHDQQLMSPESPESRRPHPQQRSFSDFDPKVQWQKVLKRLPNRHSHLNQELKRDDVSDDNNQYDERHEMKGYDMHEDDELPDTDDLHQQENIDEGGDIMTQPQDKQHLEPDNYFVNPFGPSTSDSNSKTTEESETPTTPLGPVEVAPNVSSIQRSSISSSMSHSDHESSHTHTHLNGAPSERRPVTMLSTTSEGRAKSQWGKTLDKVRLITNLQTLPHQVKLESLNSGSPLVPYYPALFDPVFIALSKDQHGDPWPPVLLPFLKVAITDSALSTQGINQWVFRIELQYGDLKWVIKRTIADFVSLHYTLKFKSSISDSVPSPPSFPSQLESWLNSAKGTIGITDTERDSDDINERHQIALKRRKALTKYLQKLLIRAHMRANYDICEFFEISAASIVEDMGWKGKEGFLEHKVNFVIPRLCHVLKPHLWNTQWVLLRDSYVAFITGIASREINDVFLFDKSLNVSSKTPGMLGKYHHNHIVMENKFRRIELKGSRREIEDWRQSIDRVLVNSPWVKNHRFGSFAPIRHNAKIRWFVDGEDHFNAVGEAILSAKSEIYIMDWWLSPELYLRRPPEKNQEFRLDRLLKRKAEEGVKIYIIVYKEMAVALTINSAHTKSWLQSLHKNIVVVRHPDHRSIDNNVLFWSHHEKIVIVDNRLAFLGGLDLCWGRYDSHKHRITDYPAKGHTDEVFPGQDYSNPRIKDFMNVAQYDLTLVDKNIAPRMPWHDMTVGMVGPIARDVARHFIQRWNFLKASKGMHRPTVPFLMPKGEYVAARDESSFKGTCRVQLLRSSAQWSSGIEREHSIYNAYMECISKSKHFIYIENQFFISTTTQDKLLRNKIAQAIVERIKRAHANGENYKVFILIPLIPAFEGDLATTDASAARNVMHFQYITISRGGNSIIEKLKEAGIEPSDYIGWYSLRNWDKLTPGEKKSSSATPKQAPAQDDSPLTNGSTATMSENNNHSDDSLWEDDCGEYVSELIYIHDKLLIVDDRIVLIGSANINDRSQLGNRDSEIAMLIEDTEMIPSFMDGKEYKAAKFAHSLRMQLFKEHLGLLNFDDWDSLLKGDAKVEPNVQVDTEVVEDHHTHELATEEVIQSYESAGPTMVLNNEKRSGDKPIEMTKIRLDAKVLDPLAPHCHQGIWNATARDNTLIYRDIFRCVPDDTVHTFEQHRKFLPDPTKVPHGHVADLELHGRDIRQRLERIRGHLVQFPFNYLKDENMLGSLIRETVTPMVIFT
ncbi:hypothetical protein BD560DRAFT_445548 [Blakeslea trispora]|nr:hypothetical protein BD560DRAFT_445548 [Blakeslea trispora]